MKQAHCCWDLQHANFASDVSKGLVSNKKFISSKYFYDADGSALFSKITRHPDYYITKCELDILNANKAYLSQLLVGEHFNLVELGPGEGLKSQILIEAFLDDRLDFIYYAIDISQDYLRDLTHQFLEKTPNLKMKTIQGDYFQGLKWLNHHSKQKSMVLFLGSSIGNFNTLETKQFLKNIWHDLKNNDYFFIGFDLRKDVNILLRAYSDNDGITKEFNLNLLSRMNRELKTDFDLKSFDHKASYNVKLHAMESFLISLKKQKIYSKLLNQFFYFRALEPIHVEYSHKYVLPEIEAFAKEAKFKIIKNFSDPKGYFINSLWSVQK